MPFFKSCCPAWSRVALQEDRSPDAAHLLPLRRLTRTVPEMLSQMQRQRSPVEMAAGRQQSPQQLLVVGMEDAVIISWGNYARRHLLPLSPHFIILQWKILRRCLNGNADLIKRPAARLSVSVRLRSVRGLQTRSPARSCCCAASYLNTSAPPRPLLSFPSSCSRLFDNGGKWVLKRQLAAAQPCSLRRGAASWLTLMASLGYRLLGSSPR